MNKNFFSIPLKYFFYKKLILLLWKLINPAPKNFLIYSGDVIGLGPQFFNNHEPHLVGAIKLFSDSKFNQFFLDIGANIGLISCLVNESFDYIEAVEPNPNCLFVLKRNFEIQGIKNHIVNEFALDESIESNTLMVPINNMGGAFKDSKNNFYGKSLRAKKDGFSIFDDKNYTNIAIKSYSTSEYFKDFFNRMEKSGRLLGIIKIDVEGMERHIIKKIGELLPRNIRLVIFFENLDKDIDQETILNFFDSSRNICIYAYQKNYKNYKYIKKFLIIIKSLILLRVSYKFIKLSNQNKNSTDLVIKIE